MLEGLYKTRLIERLTSLFPECFILKNDANYRPGVPDLIVLFSNGWAMLEVKTSAKAPYQPNQEYYIALLNEMCFSAAIYPENEEEVLDALQSTFTARRPTRIPKRK